MLHCKNKKGGLIMSENNLNWNYEDLVKHALTGGCVSCGNNSGRRRFYDNHPSVPTR